MSKCSKRPVIQRILAASMAVLFGITCFTSNEYVNIVSNIFGYNEDVSVVAHAAPELRSFYDSGTLKLDGDNKNTGWKIKEGSVVSAVTDADITLTSTEYTASGVNISCLSHAIDTEAASATKGQVLDTPNASGSPALTDYLAGIPEADTDYFYVAEGNMNYDPDAVGPQDIKWTILVWPKSQGIGTSDATSVAKTQSDAQVLYQKAAQDINYELFYDGTNGNEVSRTTSLFNTDFGKARPVWESENVKYLDWYDARALSAGGDNSVALTDPVKQLSQAVLNGHSLAYQGVDQRFGWLSIPIVNNDGHPYLQIQMNPLTEDGSKHVSNRGGTPIATNLGKPRSSDATDGADVDTIGEFAIWGNTSYVDDGGADKISTPGIGTDTNAVLGTNTTNSFKTIKDNQYNIVGIAYKAWSNSIASGYTYSMTRNPSVVRSRLASGAEFDWTMLHPHDHRDKNTADSSKGASIGAGKVYMYNWNNDVSAEVHDSESDPDRQTDMSSDAFNKLYSTGVNVAGTGNSAVITETANPIIINDWDGSNKVVENEVATVAQTSMLSTQIEDYWNQSSVYNASLDKHVSNGHKVVHPSSSVKMARNYGFFGVGLDGSTPKHALVYSTNGLALHEAEYNSYLTKGTKSTTTGTVDVTQVNITPLYDITYDYQRGAGHIKGTVTIDNAKIVSTVATDSRTRNHVGRVVQDAHITDVVTMDHLKYDTEYTLISNVYMVKDGVIDTTPSHVVTVQTTISTDGMDKIYGTDYVKSASIDIDIPLKDYAKLYYEGNTVVVYETLYLASDLDHPLYKHHSAADRNQQVSYPLISTQAKMKSSGLQQSEPLENDSIVDTVTITGVRAEEEYELTSMIYNKTDESYVGVNGNTSKVLTKFYVEPVDGESFKYNVLTKKNGTVLAGAVATHEATGIKVVFDTVFSNINLSSYAGDDLVVEQWLKSNNQAVTDSSHGNFKESTDEELHETINILSPTVSTELVDNGTLPETKGFHHTVASENTKLIDTITYQDLVTKDGLQGDVDDIIYEYESELVYVKEDGTTVTIKKTSPQRLTNPPKNKVVTSEFTFDSSETGFNLENKYVVAFNYLYRVVEDSDGEHRYLVLSEKDLTNTNQTVYFPGTSSLSTSASVNKKNSSVRTTVPDEEVTIYDKVSCVGLTTGLEYKLNTKLYDLGVKNADGNYTSGTGYVKDVDEVTDFTATAATVVPTVTFEFDASNYTGHTLVVHEFLLDSNGEPVLDNNLEEVKHADNADALQTITVEAPTLDTVATGTDTEDHTLECKKEASITDKVYYTGLVAGKSYSLSTQVYDKLTGKPIVGSSAVKTTFTPSTSSGVATVTAKVNTLSYAGRTLVVAETLYNSSSTEIAVHKDLDDADQTLVVTNPTFTTQATYGDKGTHNVPCVTSATINDEIKYDGLEPGVAYTITTTFYDKSTGKPVKVDGSALKTISTSFTPDTASGTTNVEAKIDTTGLGGKTLVVFETFSVGTVKVGGHEDINDEKQTLKIIKPTVDTVATAENSSSHTIPFSTKAVIDDEVTMTNLEVGQSYTLTATLMDKGTGKPVKGAKATAVTFEAESKDSTQTVSIAFDSTPYKGKSLVVFEELSVGKSVVTSHKDLDDEDQTVKVASPSLSTIALDSYNGTHTISAKVEDMNFKALFGSSSSKEGSSANNNNNSSSSASIIDTVSYSGLMAGESYTLNTTLVDKATGKVLTDSKPVSTSFEAKGESGTVDVTIPVDVSLHAGKTLVVYEELLAGKVIGAEHKNINDLNQTVYVGAMATILTGPSTTNPKEVSASKKLMLIDTVAYTGLEPGQTYTIVGTIMNADAVTGKTGTSNGSNNSSSDASRSSSNGQANASSLAVVYAKTGDTNDEETVTIDSDDNATTTSSSSSTNSSKSSDSTSSTVNSSTTTSSSSSTNSSTASSSSSSSSTSKGNTNNSVIGIANGNTSSNSNKSSSTTKDNNSTSVEAVPANNASESSSETTNQTTTEQTQAAGGIQTVYGTNMNPQVGTFTMAFKATASSGVLQVPFVVDASNLQGHKLVAYEVIYKGNKPILGHQDLNDANQTVTVNNTTKSSWKTGVEQHANTLIMIALCAMACAAGIVGIFAYKKRRR